jgi:hypothetical protein
MLPQDVVGRTTAAMLEDSEHSIAKGSCRCIRAPIQTLSRLDQKATGDDASFTIDEEEFPFLPTYHPLRGHSREIRLLRWAPSNNEDDMRFSLEVCSLNDCPKYVALSYTWGNNKHVRKVTVDDHSVRIRETLFEFLKSLPQNAKSVPLWLDVLCINQRDVEERNDQVASMSAIYRQATDVYCWLGTSTPNIASAWDFVQQRRRGVDPHNLASLEHDYHGQQYIEAGIIDWHTREESWCKGFRELFMRTYWSRVWILQETIVATRLWLLAGRIIFTFDEIRIVQRAIRNSSQSAFHRPIAQAKQAILSIYLGRRGFVSEHGLSTKDFFMYIRQGGCRDPRDLVFALYGVFPNEPALKADYKKTTVEVWWQACVEIFTNSFFDSLKLWDAMRPMTDMLPTDLSHALRGRLVIDVNPWHHFLGSAGPMLATTSLPAYLEAIRTPCSQHFVHVGELHHGQDLEMVFRYFEDFVPHSDDVILLCRRPERMIFSSVLRLSTEKTQIVGVGWERSSSINYGRDLGNKLIEMETDLVDAAEIAIDLKDDWGSMQLNGAAALLLLQIRALFN